MDSHPTIRAALEATDFEKQRRLEYSEDDLAFQSELPHGERRPFVVGGFEFVPIVSICAPARGATTFDPGSTSGASGFNPRSRAGSDRPRHNILKQHEN